MDRVLEEFVEEGAFPGGVVAVGHRGALAYLHPFGRLSYDEEAPAVEVDTIYDLASLTKVIATTTMAMIMVDEGRLDLDEKVQDYLPLFQGPGKEEVTVRHASHPPLRHRLVGTVVRREQRSGGVSGADPGHGTGVRTRDRLQVQRPRHHPPR